MAGRVIRERIDPRLTASLFANYRSAVDALLELVDNAIDARVPGQALKVDIGIRPGSLIVTAVGGFGMSPTQLEHDYLRWGGSRKRPDERIGRYGQGGKAAIGHLGNRLSMLVSPMGDSRAYAFEDPAYRDRARLRTYELHERSKPVAAELGYVRIEVGEVDKRLDPGRAVTRLGETYRPLLLAGVVEIRVNRAPIVPLELPLDVRHETRVRAGGRIVSGWYGLLVDPPPPGIEPGIRVHHLGRRVGEPMWFGHPGPAMHPALNRLIGELELPHVPVTMNKSDIDRDSPEWVAVEARVHKLLAPIVARLTREEGTAPSPQATRTAEQVRRILARALRLLESGKLFESEVAGGGDGPKDQLSLDQAPRDATEADEAGESGEAGDPVPPEGDAGERVPMPPPIRRAQAGGPGNARTVAEVVVRALDPRLRSAMVVEDGARRVIINSRYPLFEVRKGDLWYQLETALREVCVTIPEATVPEFERKVNELMVVSLALTGRRRRSRNKRPATQSTTPWA
ncbi:MAG TPA: ATP-binding protein [Candidatus Saccharimonadales bacterium]|nr:ATP-binding protein [Candidatus Saccharimonadales bacterium]